MASPVAWSESQGSTKIWVLSRVFVLEGEQDATMSKSGNLDGISRVMVAWLGLHPILHSVIRVGSALSVPFV